MKASQYVILSHHRWPEWLEGPRKRPAGHCKPTRMNPTHSNRIRRYCTAVTKETNVRNGHLSRRKPDEEMRTSFLLAHLLPCTIGRNPVKW